MQDTAICDEAFVKLVDLIYELTGVTIEPSKRSLVSNRVRRRMRALDLSVFDYIEHVRDLPREADEVGVFVDTVTTHKTSFFRTASVWSFLQEELLREDYEGRHLRVWSAASSTGEEPYSIAMLLHRLRGTWSQGKWRVEATDVSPKAVERASMGAYTDKAEREVSAVLPELGLASLLEGKGDARKVRREVADGVRFGVHNLLDPMPGAFDVVFLRNVIIYFSEEDTVRVVNHVMDVIKPGGLLIIGESESLLARGMQLTYEAPCIYRKTA